MAADEEHLPEELKKLELVENAPLAPALFPQEQQKIAQNPFFQELKVTVNSKAEDDLFGLEKQSKCGCRIRRNSESILEVSRSSTSTTSFHVNRTLLHQKSFKPKKKPFLREPIIKSIQQCFHRRSCPGSLEPAGVTLDALNLDTNVHKRISPPVSISTNSSPKKLKLDNSALDFRDLIEQCQSISSLPSSSNCSISKNCNSSSFKSIQTTDTRPKSTFTRNQIRNLCVSCSSSCSQQARINPTSSANSSNSTSHSNGTICDVTIDELASYFETFVHIPKKMSTMAEMMYI